MLTEPYQTLCGHYISKDAALNLPKCPLCTTEEPNPVPDLCKKREVYALQVHCHFRSRGCSWSGAMSDLKQHLQKCNYLLIQCKCGKVVRLGRMEDHRTNHCFQRPFHCTYCGHTNSYEQIAKTHQPICASEDTECPNKCREGMHMQRQHVCDHLKCCPQEMIDCEYLFAGCEFKCKRCDMNEHTICGIKHHLNLLSLYKHQILPKLKALLDQNGNLLSSANVPEQIYSPPPEIKIDNVASFFHDCKPLYSDPFYSDFGGYRMCLKIYTNRADDSVGTSTHIYVSVCVMEGEFDKDLSFPFCGEVTVQLLGTSLGYERKFEFNGLKWRNYVGQEFIAEKVLRQGNDYLKDVKFLIFRVSSIVNNPVTIKTAPPIWTGFLHVQHEQLLEHISHFPHTVYECDLCAMDLQMQLKDDIYLPALSQYSKLIHEMTRRLEIQNTALEKKKSNSILAFRPFPEFTMDNFKKYHDRDKSWKSLPFYSHFRGYKLRLRVDGYGYNQHLGTHLCVVVILMKGPFDDYLKFPFYGSITVQLVDQYSGKNHHESTIEFQENHPQSVVGRPKGKENQGLGELNYFPLKKLFSTERFLKNNSLHIRVTRIVINS